MKKALLATVILSLTTALAACSTSGGSSKESALEKAKKQGFVTVGFANETPYAYATPDGKITGEAVEIARVIVNKLGIKEMNGVVTEFGSLIPGLKATRFDIITAGMFINPTRAKEVAFANPEYSIGAAIAVPKGNPFNLHSFEDIKNNAKAKVAVMGGAAEADYLKKSGIADNQISIAPDNSAVLAALKAGRADVVTMSGPALEAVLKAANDAKLERVMDFKQPIIDGKDVRGYGAAVFRKEDNDFREAFNKELQALKDSGELLKILSQFGFTEQELPGDAKAEDLSK